MNNLKDVGVNRFIPSFHNNSLTDTKDVINAYINRFFFLYNFDNDDALLFIVYRIADYYCILGFSFIDIEVYLF